MQPGLAPPRTRRLDWKAQYSYIEDIDDGRGYTAGIIGFCSGTGDMLELVQAYTATEPGNPLATYLPALEAVNGTDSHEGLDPGFMDAWVAAAADPVFQAAQDIERDTVYFDPAVAQAKEDGLRALGQFAYYDAAVMHGFDGMLSIRDAALAVADPPADGRRRDRVPRGVPRRARDARCTRRRPTRTPRGSARPSGCSCDDGQPRAAAAAALERLRRRVRDPRRCRWSSSGDSRVSRPRPPRPASAARTPCSAPAHETSWSSCVSSCASCPPFGAKAV